MRTKQYGYITFCRGFYITLLVMMSVSSYAQLTKEETADLLTNKSKREWRYLSFSKALGAGCKGKGQVWVFNRNDTLTIKQCINGKLSVTTTTWKINAVGDEKDGEYELQFKDAQLLPGNDLVTAVRIDMPQSKKDKKRLVLRYIPDSSPKTPRTIITFTSVN